MKSQPRARSDRQPGGAQRVSSRRRMTAPEDVQTVFLAGDLVFGPSLSNVRPGACSCGRRSALFTAGWRVSHRSCRESHHRSHPGDLFRQRPASIRTRNLVQAVYPRERRRLHIRSSHRAMPRNGPRGKYADA